MAKKQLDIEGIIRQAVNAGMAAQVRIPKDIYKATERRLYALPVLRQKRQDDQERLAELKQYGPKERSKSITRFQKSGVRLAPEEIFQVALLDMEATIATDEYEIKTLEQALKDIQDDPYYSVISQKYFQNFSDEKIAKNIPCDATTVWRNRKRLLYHISVRLYGAEAVR